jgi:hypothetical protein
MLYIQTVHIEKKYASLWIELNWIQLVRRPVTYKQQQLNTPKINYKSLSMMIIDMLFSFLFNFFL